MLDLQSTELDHISQWLEARGRLVEDDAVELKQSHSELQDGARTLCAFLNRGTAGILFFGVTPKGKLVGQDCSDQTLQDIANIARKFEPAVVLQMRQWGVGPSGRHIIGVQARGLLEQRPYTFDGRAYERVGNTTRQMPQELYQQLLVSPPLSLRWESLPVSLSLDTMDHEEILRTARLGVQEGRLPESATKAPLEELLERMDLRQNGKLVNAAVVLFGKPSKLHFPQCLLRMARFKGTTKAEFIDQRQVHGHAFHLLEEALTFLRRHLPVAGRIQPGLFERKDDPLFPLKALREALVNALCHRDYVRPGGSVSLALFDDRLEIGNEGGLPAGLRVEDLKLDHPSRPRNPLIAGIFYLRRLFEQWGRGTQEIVRLCVEAGHPEPQFEEVGGTVMVRFLPRGFIAPHQVRADLTPRQRQVLQTLSNHPQLSFGQIRGLLTEAPPDRTLREDLSHLKRLGLIDLSGRGRGAVWVLGSRE